MSPTALLIDDHPIKLRRLAQALEQEGLGVIEQPPHHGHFTPATREMLDTVDAIAVDVCMPERDGFEYLRHIQALGLDAACILYSQHDGGYLDFARMLNAQAVCNLSREGERALVERVRHHATAWRRLKETPRGYGT